MTGLGIFLGLLLVSQHTFAGETENALYGIQKLMTGEDVLWEPDFYNRFATCLDTIEKPRLLQAIDAQWQGFLDYSSTLGGPQDPWYRCEERGQWFEYNCTTQEYGKIPIFEPCNYASNLAYYYTVLEICAHQGWTIEPEHVNSMAKSFAILGQGSAFFHGSQTINGGAADYRINDLFTYVAYQAAVQNLVPKNHIVTDLSYYPRNMTGMEITDFLLDVYINDPVETWGNTLIVTDFPSVRAGMCGFFATSLTLLLDAPSVDLIVNILFDLFSDMPEDLRQFCLVDFMAEIRANTNHIQLSRAEKADLMGNVIGTVIKLVYAFLWQEEVLVTNTIFLNPFVNKVGSLLLPFVNQLATDMTTFSYSSDQFIEGINLYPGQDWCAVASPHAKWHLETSIALVDFVFLAEELNKIFLAHPVPQIAA